jgi:hypothetical protein
MYNIFSFLEISYQEQITEKDEVTKPTSGEQPQRNLPVHAGEMKKKEKL